MDKENIVIIGTSGHSKVIVDIIEKENKYNIAGFLDLLKDTTESVLGYPIIGKQEDILKVIAQYQITGGIVAIGDNWVRHKVVKIITNIFPNFVFIKAIHPSVQIAKEATIEEGSVVMAGAIINTQTQIGKFCIVNTKSSLDHDCSMKNFSSIAPGTTIGGNVKIGEFSAIGLGANIIHNITIGNHVVIGAGSCIIQDICDCIVAYGVPAKVKRKRQPGEKYL